MECCRSLSAQAPIPSAALLGDRWKSGSHFCLRRLAAHPAKKKMREQQRKAHSDPPNLNPSNLNPSSLPLLESPAESPAPASSPARRSHRRHWPALRENGGLKEAMSPEERPEPLREAFPNPMAAELAGCDLVHHPLRARPRRIRWPCARASLDPASRQGKILNQLREQPAIAAQLPSSGGWDHLYSWYCPTSTSSSTAIASSVRTEAEQ